MIGVFFFYQFKAILWGTTMARISQPRTLITMSIPATVPRSLRARGGTVIVITQISMASISVVPTHRTPMASTGELGGVITILSKQLR